jgi:subtilisin-like proprotein convertase family protein
MFTKRFAVVVAIREARRRHGVAQRMSVGVLAVTLASTSMAPVLAQGVDQRPHGTQHHQAQVNSALARGKGKTVTKTFANTNAIIIPKTGSTDNFGPANPYPSTIRVGGPKNSRITDVNLTLQDFGHTFSRDVDVLLVAPGGRNAVVMGDVGGIVGAEGDVKNLTLTLDDEAAALLPGEAKLTSGTFRPRDQFGLDDADDINSPDLTSFPAPAPTPSGKNALSIFDGSDPNGEWRLFVVDDSRIDTGALAGGWSLEMTTKHKRARHKKH